MSNTVSYSRLSLYETCPEQYRLRYHVKPSGCIAPLQEPLIKGTLAHTCIEEYLQGHDKEVAIQLALHDWLKNVCGLKVINEDPEKKGKKNKDDVVSVSIDIYDDDEEDWLEVSKSGSVEGFSTSEGEGVHIGDLYEYATECGWLLHRCSSEYQKEDKIRNRDGSIPKSPLNYPPGEFKRAYEEKGLSIIKGQIDAQACRGNVSFARISLANIAAEAVSFIYNFELPTSVKSVDSIEYCLSDQKVYFGDDKDVYWNGKIDTVYTSHEGAKIINDHKTEREVRRPQDVCFDLQLNSYASVMYEQSGQLADYIAITHLGTNSFITSHTHIRVMNQAMEYLEGIQRDIKEDLEKKGPDKPWKKKWPNKYGSPCLSRYQGVLSNVCPYIYHCWPDYASTIKEELKDYLGY